MTSPAVVYETAFRQAFYHKGVDLSPREHAEARMSALRQSYLATAVKDPRVSVARFGIPYLDGVGNEWTIHFSEKEPYGIVVEFDDRTKDKWTGKRTRRIGYVLTVTVVQTNIPNVGSPASPPPHFLLSLV
jgi:hypothetical protein